MSQTEQAVDSARQLARFLLRKRTTIVYIDGSKIADKKSLLREFAAQMSFPEYFGFNWDAFNDCLQDLSWLDKKHGVVVIYNNPQLLMSSSPEDWSVASAILLEAVRYWNDRGTPMFLAYS